MNKNIQETYVGKKIDNVNVLNITDAANLLDGKKICIVTGVTGQDGSYMVDYLLKNTDLFIVGGVRRLSVYNHININHINNPRFLLLNFDLTDSHSIARIVEKLQPEYFINLAAQSFVASSWDFARQTWQTNSTSVLDILESIRLYKPSCRFYQAGSSEEFGNVSYVPQDEKHPLKPRSPYGASKAAARQLVKVYRDSYDLYAIQGWLFNHECLTARTPVILKNKYTNLIDIKPIEEIVPHRKDASKGTKYTTINECEYLVWDNNNWQEIKTRTATWNDKNHEKNVLRIMSRGGFYEATSDHKSFKHGEIETATKNLKTGDRLELKSLPPNSEISLMSEEEAEFLGLMSAEGYISKDRNSARFTNKDAVLCNKIKNLWSKISIGYTSEYYTVSGYTQKKDILNINLLGDSNYLNLLRDELYTKSGEKRVPQKILNSNKKIIEAYLRGYNYGDGLKAGNQNSELQGFTTNSYTLSAGLCFLLNILEYRFILCPEERGDKIYFKININVKNSKKGEHLKKSLNEITKISKLNYVGWLFDLETSSNTFSAGVGFSWVHNSERRGVEFVTRKITTNVARIRHSIKSGSYFSPLELGNIDAKRDWSHAMDFVEGIWLMLNQENPKEYVLSSNETHTVREFVEKAFKFAGIDGLWTGEGINEKYVLSNKPDITLMQINEKFYRPAEVELLLGDSTLAREELNWTPKISFDELVKRMVENDLKIQI
jgi:GDPmannose 4,6-dehydratase